MTEYFVAKNGNDCNNGSEEAPFASLAGARDFIRKWKGNLPDGGVTVTVMPGEYSLREGLDFDERDSGTAEARICYRASAQGAVTLNSGVSLRWEDFRPVAEKVKKRLISPEAREKVRQLDLKEYGLTAEDWGKLYAYGAYTTADKYEDGKGPMYCELFCGEERMTLSRYPNEGYLLIQEVLDNGDASETYDTGKTVKLLDKWDAMRSPRGGTFTLDSETTERIRRWAPDDDRWIFGFFKWDWADASTRIARLDAEKGVLTTEHAACYGFTPGGKGQGGRFYFYNILEELDRPGEWYLDRKTGILYFYPPEGAEGRALTLTVSSRSILTLNHSHYLTFSGFCLKGSRGNAVTAEGNGNRIEQCSISLIGGGAIDMTGEENQVTQCEISHVGSFGIKLTGGDRQTLTKSHNGASYNLIHHWSEVINTYQGGITLNGVGGLAAHNELHHSPHTAVFYTGNGHLIEYNRIHDVCLNTRDAGAIYSGRSYTWYGNVIRYNYLYCIGSPMGEAHGIYFDDNLSGQTAYGNILEEIRGAAFLIGGGQEIDLRYNLMIRADWSIHYDARGREGLLEGGWYGNALAPHTDEIARLKEVDIRSEIWAAHYPKLAKMKWSLEPPEGVSREEYYDDADFALNPSYSVIRDNVFCQCGGCWSTRHPSVARYSDFTEEGNLVTDEIPAFEVLEDGSIRLPQDSELFRKIPDLPFGRGPSA